MPQSIGQPDRAVSKSKGCSKARSERSTSMQLSTVTHTLMRKSDFSAREYGGNRRSIYLKFKAFLAYYIACSYKIVVYLSPKESK
ncbi:hypothetical protein HYE67_002084 [Fusarium culmorum]|uniref:Uncharacterized protein n=1 Tax=Fusarium culmorum TaxID=5516 RepID=A0A2T4GSC3_FUSCU|nr:hypothetical protein FCULG_00006283 [Fusarium culmorum]QPC59853.1 hypothetical protein HYE67_002084 [Fusarium culmorum]